MAVPLKPIHFDDKIYPEPYKFDCFRFSNLRESEDSDVKYRFTTTEKGGLGRHACPGRFFASMELKIILSHLNYDMSLANGAKEAPKPTTFSTGGMPDMKACIILTPRVGQAGQDLRF
ncbi:cytochrome P450 [Mycena galopus ATCC 62051]|nr:cytochrome P450 [Mycena galopus ATCC 62051]